MKYRLNEVKVSECMLDVVEGEDLKAKLKEVLEMGGEVEIHVKIPEHALPKVDITPMAIKNCNWFDFICMWTK